MIDPKELRIGNIVSDKGNQPNESYYVVSEITRWIIHFRHISDGTTLARKHDQVSPIPLTPEILVACGFVEFGACYTLSFDSMRINILTESMEVKLSDSIWNNKHSLLHIDYLHQLQNAVHALTGYELTFNPEKVKV